MFVSSKFSIPSGNECCILVKVPDCVSNVEGVFVGNKLKLNSLGIVTANCVTKSCDGFIPICLCNVVEHNVILPKNVYLGTFEVETNPIELNMVSEEKHDSNQINSLLQNIGNNTSLNKIQKNKVINLIEEYKNVFSVNKKDFGFYNLVEHEIDIQNNSPIQRIIGKVPLNVETWVDEQVESLEKSGIISKSTSPWCAPIVVVRKKSGDLRMCIDYRRLNSITIKPIYNIPDSQSLFNHLSGAKWFSTLDVSNAYYQCGIRDKDRKYTAFATRKGHWQFNRMPFGLSGAPFTFQRLMHTVLRNENWMYCLIYLDDVLIFANDFDEHLGRVKIILDKIQKSGLKLSPLKCNFFLNEVNYLGHIISCDGIKTDPEKVKIIRQWPLPNTVFQLRQFLGFVNYYRRFIKNCSNLTKDLENVLKNSFNKVTGVKKGDTSLLTWCDTAKISFTKLKNALCSAPCLSYPKRDETFILDTDASHYAIGSVLSQVIDGEERVISYASRKLSKAEVKYCITRKELLSVHYFVTYFRQFLLGRKFVVRTDHRALKWLLSWEKPSTSQYCSWVADLEIYDFIIKHRPGSQHTNADFLSRPVEKCMQCELIHSNPCPKGNVKILSLEEELTLTTNQLRDLHNQLGHIGRDKMKSVVKKMGHEYKNIDIENIINNCQACAERKICGGKEKERLHTLSNFPFQDLVLDVAGPLPRSTNGNRFLLSILDIFTRNIILVPLRNTETNTIINAFQQRWVSHYGYPNQINTDGGTYFTSREMQSYLARKGIIHHVGSPYHAASNGLVERYFFTVKDMMYAACRSKQLEWDTVLWEIEFGLRSSTQRHTGHSPFEIMYGFTPKISRYQKAKHDYKELQISKGKIYRSIRERNSMLRQKTYVPKFKTGQSVMFRVAESKPGVYNQRFYGPGKIITSRPNRSYNILYQGRTYIRHENHIKAFNGNSKSPESVNTSLHSCHDNKITVQRYPSRHRQPFVRFGYNS